MTRALLLLALLLSSCASHPPLSGRDNLVAATRGEMRP